MQEGPINRVEVRLGERSYAVVVGAAARAELRTQPALAKATSCVAIADDRVAELHLERLLESLPVNPLVIRVAPGEASKSLATAGKVYETLARSGVDRHALLVTFGGGMVGDLGGFVAATWLRGLPFIQVPTTLEAAVDASVGGKTAVNLPAGKNLVGAFHQPVAVLVDVDFLETLPDRDFVAGLGESIKHALIRDPGFLAWHEDRIAALKRRDAATVTELIGRNVAIKADVVSRDEREQGLRGILNYGHTIGHALEHLLAYELRHGECVGLGMLAVNEIARRRGIMSAELTARVQALIAGLGLPTRLPQPVAAEEVVQGCRVDKKSRGGKVNFVFVSEPGQVKRADDVSDAEIAAAVAMLQP